jgi:glutamate-5-semialdehyde dehydrogenase
LAVKTVSSIEAAIDYISVNSSKHSETIIAENEQNIEQFLQQVDAAVVYSNVSTAFTDGAQFGLGAEIGISTQKLHARGPMALKELCSYKWVVRGSGQVRS